MAWDGDGVADSMGMLAWWDGEGMVPPLVWWSGGAAKVWRQRRAGVALAWMWRQGGDGVGQCGDGMSHGISVTAASCGDGDGLGGTVALVAYV